MLRPLLIAHLLWLGASTQGFSGAEENGSPANDAPELRVRRWTADDGLPTGRVACLERTRDGYLWIGTWAGLVRFNGVSFRVFNRFNTPELVSDTINGLAQDADGTLWIATSDGLVSYRERQFQRLAPASGLPEHRDIQRVIASRSGGIWVQVDSSVARLEDGRLAPGWPLQPPVKSDIRALAEGPDGWLNIIQCAAWLDISPAGNEIRTNWLFPGGTSYLVNGFPGWRAGTGWVATRDGLRLLGAQGLMPFAEAPLNKHGITVVYHDRTGGLWAGTAEGRIYFRLTNNWELVELGLGAVVCAEQDREGDLWFGCDLGLAQVHQFSVRCYGTHDGLVGNNVLSVCEGGDGTIWAGTTHGLSCLRDGAIGTPRFAEPYIEYEDRSVWPAPNGHVLVSKPGVGVLEVWAGGCQQRIGAAALPGLANVLYGDHSGRLWVGTSGGVTAFEPGQWLNPCFELTNAPAQDVRSILQTRDGTIWLGTKQNGLVRLRDGRLRHFTVRDGLSDESVWSLLEDGDGTLWIGTKNGLTRYKWGRWFAFRQQQGLPESTVNCVLEDDAGDLWLGGLHGVHRARRAELNAVAEGRAATAEFFTVGTADGMVNPETNGGENQPAGWKAHDGRLWFPTVSGLVVINPKSFAAEKPAWPAVIEGVKADEVVLRGHGAEAQMGARASNGSGGVHSLPAGHGHALEFTYTANSLVAPERIRFRYRLIGVNSHWQPETSRRSVQYNNLRPGTYTFEVIAADQHHVWNRQPAAFAFSLEPFFWQTWPFYAVCACTAAGLVLVLQRYRLRWQHRLLKLEEQRALAAERARIARDLHDDLGTALTGLALELDVLGRQDRSHDAPGQHLAQTAQRTRDLADRMREVVWTVNPRCDTVSSLASFLEQQVAQFLGAEGLRFQLDFPEAIPELPLGAAARHQLALSVREALTNVVRHARATEVRVCLRLEPGELEVRVQDNGQGFRPCQTDGNGLANMKTRMEQVGGSFMCQCEPGGGTVITFRLSVDPTAGQERFGK